MCTFKALYQVQVGRFTFRSPARDEMQPRSSFLQDAVRQFRDRRIEQQETRKCLETVELLWAA